MKAVLVFGGTGFLGSSFVKYLLGKNLKVIAYKHKKMGFLSDVINDNLIIIDSFDEKLLCLFEVETIFHLASKQTLGDPTYDELYKGNVEVTKKIIDFCKLLHIKQFVYVSTTTVYSKNTKSRVFDENTHPNPKNHYGLTKYIAEKLVEIEMARTDIKTCIVRFPSIFGLNSKGGIVDTFYKLSKDGSDIEVYSNGQRLRNLIHVNSATRMLYLLYKNREKLAKHEIFMAGSEDSLNLLDIAKLIVRLTDSKSVVIPVDKFPPSDFDVVIDTTKAKELLIFKPFSIEDGLKSYIQDIENENL